MNEQPHSSSTLAVVMSLRDWFAGKALQGLLAVRVFDFDGSDVPLLVEGVGLRWNNSDHPARLAALAYEMADAMLALREGPPPAARGGGDAPRRPAL